jgi:purine-binding chemotaxis protein CheW
MASQHTPRSHAVVSVPEESTAIAQPGQYLIFRVAEEDYAVSVLQTSEILEYRSATPVPGAPAWVAGMLSLRGTAIALIDLAAKFGLAGRQPTSSSCIVVLEIAVEGELNHIGVIVDAMPSVVDLGPGAIAPPPLFGTLVHVQYLSGMARLESGLVLILDADSALTAEEVAVLSALEGQAPGAGDRGAPHPAGDSRAENATDGR